MWNGFCFDIIFEYLPLLLKGTLWTIGISILSICFGSVLGLAVGLGKMSHRGYLRWPTSMYVNFFRGTPLLVQILLVHFGVVPLFIGSTNPIIASIVALSLNSAGYMAEIFRCRYSIH